METQAYETNDEGEPEARLDQLSSPSEQPAEVPPRIYVADLAAYNNGLLHGVWLDAAAEPEALSQGISRMLRASPLGEQAEEWAIHDFEGFNGLHLGEWENLGYVSKVASGIVEHGLAYAHYAQLAVTDEELEQFADRYLGEWASLADYAENILADLGLPDQIERAVPENLRPYVVLDSEGFARDLELGGDVWTAESSCGVYVFSSY